MYKKTVAAAEERSDFHSQRKKQLKEAEEYCKREKVRAVACLNANPHLTLVKRTALEDRLKGTVVTGEEYKHERLLTRLENDQLVDFLIERNLARDGQSLPMIAEKVQDILKIRQTRNRQAGRSVIPLSPEARKIATGERLPSQVWFLTFFADNKDRLGTKVVQTIDAKRAAAANEDTVDERFNGVYGRIAELKHAGRVGIGV